MKQLLKVPTNIQANPPGLTQPQAKKNKERCEQICPLLRDHCHSSYFSGFFAAFSLSLCGRRKNDAKTVPCVEQEFDETRSRILRKRQECHWRLDVRYFFSCTCSRRGIWTYPGHITSNPLGPIAPVYAMTWKLGVVYLAPVCLFAAFGYVNIALRQKCESASQNSHDRSASYASENLGVGRFLKKKKPSVLLSFIYPSLKL